MALDDIFKHFGDNRYEGDRTTVVRIIGITRFGNRRNHYLFLGGWEGGKFERKEGDATPFKDDGSNTVRTGWFGDVQRT